MLSCVNTISGIRCSFILRILSGCFCLFSFLGCLIPLMLLFGKLALFFISLRFGPKTLPVDKQRHFRWVAS